MAEELCSSNFNWNVRESRASCHVKRPWHAFMICNSDSSKKLILTRYQFHYTGLLGMFWQEAESYGYVFYLKAILVVLLSWKHCELISASWSCRFSRSEEVEERRSQESLKHFHQLANDLIEFIGDFYSWIYTLQSLRSGCLVMKTVKGTWTRCWLRVDQNRKKGKTWRYFCFVYTFFLERKCVVAWEKSFV